MNKQLTLTAHVWKEENSFIAQCIEYDVASQGDTIDEALANLREAVELYLEPPTATIAPELYKFTIPSRAA